MNSMQHSWDAIQRLAANLGNWKEFDAVLQDATRSAWWWLPSQKQTMDMDSTHWIAMNQYSSDKAMYQA